MRDLGPRLRWKQGGCSRFSSRFLGVRLAPLPPGDIGGHFVNEPLVEFAPPLRRRLLLEVCQVGLGSTSALETGRMLAMFFVIPRVFLLLLVPHWLLATLGAFS